MIWLWNIRYEVWVVMFWSRVYVMFLVKDFNIKYKYYYIFLLIDFIFYYFFDWLVLLYNRY